MRFFARENHFVPKLNFWAIEPIYITKAKKVIRKGRKALKIDGVPGNIARIYQTNQNKADGAVRKNPIDPSQFDSVELTDQAQRIHALVKETNGLPEIREEKIARIKSEIANGTYNVTPEQVAAKMLAADKE